MPAGPFTEAQRAYYVGFVAVLVGAFSPSKLLGYALPLLLVVWLLLSGTVSRNRVLALLVAVSAVAALYVFIADEFLLVNYLVAVVTYAAFAPAIVVESRTLASRDLLLKMLVVSASMVMLQGCVGTLQAVYGALQSGSFGGDNGDHVAGTIHPSLEAEHAFSNPMFAVNISMMLLCAITLPEVVAGRRRLYFAIGAIALVLASVLHVLIFLVVAVVFAFLFTRGGSSQGVPRRTGAGKLVTFVVLVIALSYVALPDNVAAISRVGERAFELDSDDIPRAILLARVIGELPEDRPLQPLVGVGPGQFCSRASLIMSGRYLGGADNPKPLPLLEPQATSLASDYCIALLLAMTDAEADVGSSQQPFFSWLSVYTELGAFGSLVLIAALAQLLLAVRRRVARNAALRTQGTVFVAGCGFLFLLGWQANYWETPQALLVGVLLLKVVHANIMFREEP